jgi:Ca2+-binding RTX toxin-like protein
MRRNQLRPLRGLTSLCGDTLCRRPTFLALAALVAAFAFGPTAAAVAQVAAGDVVVADPNAFGGNGGLIDLNPDSGAQRTLSDEAISSQDLFRDPSGVAFDPISGSLIVADPSAFDGSGGLIKVDPETGQQSALSSNASSIQKLFEDPVGVVRSPSGALYVTDPNAFGGSGGVIAVDPASGQESAVSNNAISPTPLFSNPHGIAFEAGGTILVADPDSPVQGGGTEGAIIAIDPATGAQKLITGNASSQTDLFGDPLGVAVETPGTLLVANTAAAPSSTGVILVNRSSGQQYALSTDAGFVSPSAIAMDLDGKALVADRDAFGGNGGVIRVDPVTGARTILSGNPNAPDALFVDPSGIIVVPPTCLGRYATIVGTEGADAITGTAGPDVISARGGDDIVDGGAGKDLICGDDGRDRLIGHDGRDSFLGGSGSDVILGGNGADTAKGELGRDKIDGGRGSDKLYGQQKPDVLAGGKGNDLLSGGRGRDKLRGGPGHDRLRGGAGVDKVQQ